MKIVECPRDAMQGIEVFIPTELKVRYINALLKVGFHTVDFGSFVSPKMIPQMRDTAKVLSQLELNDTESELLAIVANMRGAEDACKFDEIGYLGFPFSISEVFQQRNTNATQEEAYQKIELIHNLCEINGKDLVVYLSMCFGNPYNELWHEELVSHWVDRFASMGVNTISLSDTVGVASSEQINKVFANVTENYPDIEIGAHFHTHDHNWREKVEAAHANGCTRFDGAVHGFGGCPYAQNSLVGNMPTEYLIEFLEEKDVSLDLDMEAFAIANRLAWSVFMVPV